MKGAGQVFAPSPSAQQVADYASANNMSVADAAKVMSPGLMRTYGPGIAAGIAATKAMGGFDTQPTTPSAARADVEDRLAKERAEVAANPGKYVPQGIPGLIYNDKGEIIGSKPWGSTATMDDIRVDTPDYVPRQKGSNYTAPQGAITQKGSGQSIYQPYNTADMYTNLVDPYKIGAPLGLDPMPRYYADGGNVAGGYSSGMPVHALFGGEIDKITGSIAGILKPAEKALSSSVVTSAPASTAAPTPAPPSSFSKDPFGKISKADFEANADAVAKERDARVAQVQADYETRNRNRQALDAAYAASGSARGKRIFFDPRDKNRPPNPDEATTMPVVIPAPKIGKAPPGTEIPKPRNSYNIAPATPARPVPTVGYAPQPVIQPPVYRPPAYQPPPPPAPPVRGPVASKRTGGIANLTESRYYPRKTGHISGPGTQTSDSIPAMLSDGEFVMTAKAVKSLGKGDRRAGAKKMYALMHQLERNASRG